MTQDVRAAVEFLTLPPSPDTTARTTDQPIAALLADPKGRGLLEDTLVLWGGEFG
jgi:hypothetical protein